MKKQVALAVAAALSLSVAGTALAAPANPFVDVPANHWAYDALTALQKDGVVTGYGDGTFRGDRNLTRYEMAAMIAKITVVDDKNGPLIKRLQSEFATELYNLGVRVDKLERGASSIKFTGDARIRYQQGAYTWANATDDNEKKSSRFQQRIHLNLTADVNENVKFIGQIRAENTSNGRNRSATTGNFAQNYKESNTDSLWFQRAEFAYRSGSFGLSAGRLNPTLGHGLIWDGGRADGFMASYNGNKVTLATGIVDVSPEFDGAKSSSANAWVAHLGYKISERVNLSAAYLNMSENNSRNLGTYGQDGAFDIGEGAKVRIWSVGASADIAKDLKLTGEYAKNSGVNNNNMNGDDGEDFGDDAWRVKLNYKTANYKKPGSYALFTEYVKLGGNAVFGGGSGALNNQWVATNNRAMFGEGVKGWGLGGSYVPAKNIRMDVQYHVLESYSGRNDYNNTFTFATNFLF